MATLAGGSPFMWTAAAGQATFWRGMPDQRRANCQLWSSTTTSTCGGACGLLRPSSGRRQLVGRTWRRRALHYPRLSPMMMPVAPAGTSGVHARGSILSDGSSGADGDEDYVESSVLEAVEVKSGSEGFLIKMRDGRYIKCVHNNPEGSRLPDYAPQPAIVLKVEDGSNLLLPIIVLELPSAMLMEAVRNVHIARPTIYQVLRNLIELMGFKAKLVRVTRRVQEAYYAQLFLSKQVGDEVEEVSLDLRPSDAINIAARCQVPIQVNRQLAYGDGVRIVSDPAKLQPSSSSSSRPQRFSGGVVSLFTELDRPQTETSCVEAEEFVLVRSMLMATAEERYMDAARIRDELRELRSKKRN